MFIQNFSEKIPEIRRDIQIIPIQDQGRQLLCFHDSLGYIPPGFALDAGVQPLLGIFSGRLSIDDIISQLNGSLSKEEILGFVNLLDENRLLDSRFYRKYANEVEQKFEAQHTRPAYLSGLSYPDSPEELQAFLADIITPEKPPQKKINALYAPHIDIAIGQKQYGEAFSYLKELEPKRVIILATSHYAGYYGKFYNGFPFIGSAKQFSIPGREFRADTAILEKLAGSKTVNGFSLHDRAHRVEHSIEIHLVFASAVWQHEFTIVPILVSGFEELFYLRDGDLAQKIDQFTAQLSSLIDEDTFVLISGDLSHVGKKFGDQSSASDMKQSVSAFDQDFLDSAASGNSESLLNTISENYDSTQICGFPPLYTFLKMSRIAKGEIINYDWWDEKEKESAVSFGSVLYNFKTG